MRYRCISVLEGFICTQDYTSWVPAWGLPVKMLNIFIQKLGVSDPSARGPGLLWTPLARTLSALATPVFVYSGCTHDHFSCTRDIHSLFTYLGSLPWKSVGIHSPEYHEL
jgi:hypothetical protein